MKTFNFFIKMEIIFRKNINLVKEKNINLREFFITKFLDIPFVLPNCHDLKFKICSRFAIFRLKISSRKGRAKNVSAYASKTMAMHTFVR